MEGPETTQMDREKCLRMINIFRDIGNGITPMKQEQDVKNKENLIIRKKHLKIKIMAAGKKLREKLEDKFKDNFQKANKITNKETTEER